ncbi:hypothetical protein AWC29_10940 [Mycobacterium triplex]|uniref:PPE family protein n=1 Tax=Mycobacterium triplex TaxID=47839 RepID=A0A024JRB0_9MYCO|nr:PPE family protein [Mycobacterium triplex]ORX05364.1 hypothetical protein AWC29_10940 [Mycobacterium triplex]CDO85748.1 PPE family protein [Mycobacterium triplex]
MDFGLLPPEVNSGLMYTGPGSGPMLAAAASWDAVAAELEAAAAGCSSEIAGLTGRWLGPSSMRMAGSGTRQAMWLQTSAAQAARTAAQAYSAAAAFETAYAMTVPPPVIAANRAQLMVLIATNFLGQNTPAIAATEAQYMEMWVQDATAMYGYAAAAETASTLEPFDEPQQSTNPNGQTDQATAVARAAGDTTTARTQSAIQMATSDAAQQLVNATPIGPAGTYGPGTYVAPSGGTVIIGEGSSVTLRALSRFDVMFGGVVTIESGSSLTVNSGVPFSVGNGCVATIEAGSIVTMQGGSSLTLNGLAGPSSMTISNSIVTLGSSAFWSTDAGTIDVISGVLSTTGANTVISGTYTIAPAVTPVAPAASASGLGAASAATGVGSSPGLAGAAGIQPQFDVGALMQWSQGINGADLAAGLAEVG